MAITWGSWAGYVRLGIDITGSGTTYTIKLYVGWNGGVSFSNTITRGGSWAGSKACALDKPWGAVGQAQHYAVSQTFTGTRTYSASFPTPWGTASVSRSVTGTAPTVTKPGAPANVKITRPNDTTLAFTFTRGSNATKTQLMTSRNGETTRNHSVATGGSHTVTGAATDSWYRWWLQSWNNTGQSSAAIGPYTTYTKPKTPTVPLLGDGRSVAWSLPSLYKHGVEVQRTDNAGVSVSTVELGPVTVWTDPNAQTPSTQYRVRCWVGPSYDQAKTYSDWSGWSKTFMAASYAPPKIRKFTVARCNSAGELTEMGTYLRCTYSGSTVSVKDGATETNWATRRVKWRKKGTSSWTQTTLLNKGAPGTFTNMFATVGAGAISVTDVFEVAFELEDAYSGTVQQIVTVPVAQVAFSIAERGVGVGKTWERGALDVAGDMHLSGNAYIQGNIVEAEPRMIVVRGSTVTAAVGTHATQSLTWPNRGKIPIVFGGFASGSKPLRGSVTVSDVTATGCQLRVDNMGTAANPSTPVALLMYD